jgi:hypothetical protein
VATDSGKHAGAAGRRVAAGQVAGQGRAFTAVPAFWSDQYDMRIQSFGVTGPDDTRVLEGALDGDVAVGYHRGGRLVGVVLIGLGARYTRYRAQIAGTITELAGQLPGEDDPLAAVDQFAERVQMAGVSEHSHYVVADLVARDASGGRMFMRLCRRAHSNVV